jgi:hypothetical protein
MRASMHKIMFGLGKHGSRGNAQSLAQTESLAWARAVSPVIFQGATLKNHFTVYQAAAFARASRPLHNLAAGYQKKKVAKKKNAEAPLRSDESGSHSRGAELRLKHNIQACTSVPGMGKNYPHLI